MFENPTDSPKEGNVEMVNNKKNFMVNYTQFDTLADAENYARKQAWRGGSNEEIYKLFAVAKAPELVNQVQIDPVS